MKAIFTVEELVDLGTQVVSVFEDRDMAQELYDKLESERISYMREMCAESNKPFYDYYLYPKYELNEYEVIERRSAEPSAS